MIRTQDDRLKIRPMVDQGSLAKESPVDMSHRFWEISRNHQWVRDSGEGSYLLYFMLIMVITFYKYEKVRSLLKGNQPMAFVKRSLLA